MNCILFDAYPSFLFLLLDNLLSFVLCFFFCSPFRCLRDLRTALALCCFGAYHPTFPDTGGLLEEERSRGEAQACQRVRAAGDQFHGPLLHVLLAVCLPRSTGDPVLGGFGRVLLPGLCILQQHSATQQNQALSHAPQAPS